MTDIEEKSLAAHVKLCQERYEGILRRMGRVEYILVALVVVLVANGNGPLTQAVIGLFGR